LSASSDLLKLYSSFKHQRTSRGRSEENVGISAGSTPQLGFDPITTQTKANNNTSININENIIILYLRFLWRLRFLL
jgi:hypothetical protein